MLRTCTRLIFSDCLPKIEFRPVHRAAVSIRIRYETPHDFAAIEAVTVAAFLGAPHSRHNEQLIIVVLRGSGQLSVSLVAEDDGGIIGHVAASPVSVSDGTSRWYGLGPISVAPAHQGKGIGTRLIEGALAKLRSLGADGCVVLGDPAFYSRFRFLRRSCASLARRFAGALPARRLP